MVRTKGTTPKAFQLQFRKQPQDTINNINGDGESSFRLLYYGDASAGSVPFMWESHPGTPKPSTTQSSLPTSLTPPPTSLRTLFLDSSFRKPHVEAAPVPLTTSSCSSVSSQQSRTSLRTLFLASSFRKAHVAASSPVTVEKHVGGGGGGGSPLCFGGGGGLMMVCRIKKVKKALMSIGGRGKGEGVS